MRARCQAIVGQRAYSPPGRCEKRAGVKPIVVREGHDKLRVKLCIPHRKILEAHKPIAFAP